MIRSSHFQAMASPCELLIETPDQKLHTRLFEIARAEAARIETKYSRYLKGSVVDRIHSSRGARIHVDEETARLLDYADECYRLSGGLFDITTGALRNVWGRFDGGVRTPDTAAIEEAQRHIGWDQVVWQRPYLQLPIGMEIDFGGIGKEYAADRILSLLWDAFHIDTLVNLGGDIAAAGSKRWSVGLENPRDTTHLLRTFELTQGGLATSGITKRYIRIGGETLGHILNPKTGWPVKRAPLSVTVTAKTCTEAGFWSTLAVLHGAEAAAFLAREEIPFWCVPAPCAPEAAAA